MREVPDVNRAPMFESASMMREVEENTDAKVSAVGDPVTADDPDFDVLTYNDQRRRRQGCSFTIDDETGQIEVGEGTTLNFESSKTTYEVEVTATDPFGEKRLNDGDHHGH